MDRPGALPLEDRAVAPDLARGAMLLLIALANGHVWLYGRVVGPRGYPAGLAGPDRVVAALQLLLVDGRAYPLFGLLFGYGVTQLARRRGAAGLPPDEVVRLVRRRGGGMTAIGFVHGVLLWTGDIVGAYGLLAVLLAGVLVRGGPGSLAGIALGGAVSGTALGAFAALAPRPGTTATLPSVAVVDPVTAAAARLVEWGVVGLLVQAGVVASAVAAGAWAGRRRLLEDPARHRPLLVRLAVAGLAAAVLGGLPLALVVAGVWGASTPALLVCGVLHAAGGYAGGVGYAALFGLLAARAGHRLGPAARAVRACGQRSLSCYLAQSVAFAALLPAWSLGLGAHLTVARTALLAVGVWAVILVVAAVSARAGYRGPAEVLLRRLTYGPTPRPVSGRRSGGRPGGGPVPPGPPWRPGGRRG
jgi:uncharacterized membrane protein YeiB